MSTPKTAQIEDILTVVTDLATMVGEGFQKIDERFDEINSQLDSIHTTLAELTSTLRDHSMQLTQLRITTEKILGIPLNDEPGKRTSTIA